MHQLQEPLLGQDRSGHAWVENSYHDAERGLSVLLTYIYNTGVKETDQIDILLADLRVVGRDETVLDDFLRTYLENYTS